MVPLNFIESARKIWPLLELRADIILSEQIRTFTKGWRLQELFSATKAPSTLIRFQTKTELFFSVFKKICVHTYRFRIVFGRPHYNAVSV